MNLRALVGWGIVIYAVLFLVWSGLAIHGLSGSFLARLMVLLSLVIIATIATRSLHLTNEGDVAPYAIGWVIIAAIMDAVFTVPGSGWAIYTNWNLWVGYVLLLCVPFIVTVVSKKHSTI